MKRMEYMQGLVALNRKKRTGGGRRFVIFGAVMLLLCTPGLAAVRMGKRRFPKRSDQGEHERSYRKTDR